MARIAAFRSFVGSGRTTVGDVRAMIWAGLVLGLLWVNFERWTAPAFSPGLPVADAPVSAPGVQIADPPDPWAQSRRDRIALEAQEGAPLPARSATADAATAGRVTIRSAVRVVDGDTFWLGGDKIRIADIDTPETHPPRCAEEAELGEKATRRLEVLLDARSVRAPADRRSRRGPLRPQAQIVTRNGRSLGDMLVAEGLARTWTGRREPWCCLKCSASSRRPSRRRTGSRA